MNYAILLAGGNGSRMGKTEVPKQFLILGDKKILAHSLITFNKSQLIDGIFVVCSSQYENELIELIEKHKIHKFISIVKPGETRSESSFHALQKVKEDLDMIFKTNIKNHNTEKSVVLIHDVARPLVSEKIILNNVNAAKKYGACETVLPSVDTILESTDGIFAEKTLDRSKLYTVQTPQSFDFDLVFDAYNKYYELPSENRPPLTDDVSLVQHFSNIKVSLVEGSKFNMKLTTKEDLIILEAFYNEYKKNC